MKKGGEFYIILNMEKNSRSIKEFRNKLINLKYALWRVCRQNETDQE
jgi:hypothetical protein